VTRHELKTYDDTTSLIAALDAVIANIGKPVHLIPTAYEDWRWGTGDTTPWYPTITIYRGNVRKSLALVSERLSRRSISLASASAV